MHFKKIASHLLIVVYLVITASGALYSFTRYAVPFIPFRVMWFSYGMMAPYRGLDDHASSMSVEGRRAGELEWEVFSIDQYEWPFMRAEKIVRWSSMPFATMSDEMNRLRYKSAAEKILEYHDQYESVRLVWEQWPLSYEGYETHRREPFVHRKILIQVP